MKRRKPPAPSKSPDSTCDTSEHSAAPAGLAQQPYSAGKAAASSPAWSCAYGAETAACSNGSDTAGMQVDLHLEQILQEELAACAALSTEAPACQLPQLQVPQGFMGMPAACSTVLSPSPAGEGFDDILAAAMQQELQQCLEQQQLQQQSMRSTYPVPAAWQQHGGTAMQAVPAAVVSEPWSDSSNNSSTLPIVDVYSGLVNQSQAQYAAAAHCPAAVAAADEAALIRTMRLQELMTKQRQLEHAVVAAALAAGSTIVMHAGAPSARMQTSMPAQFPAGPAQMPLSSSASVLPAGRMGQSGGLYRMPTVASVSSAISADVQRGNAHMKPAAAPDCKAAVAQRLNQLQDQFAQVAAQLGQLREMMADRLVLPEPASTISTGTCYVPGMSMM